jgi:hypothetical protein
MQGQSLVVASYLAGQSQEFAPILLSGKHYEIT